MRGTLNSMLSSARSKHLAVHPDLPVPVEIHAVRSSPAPALAVRRAAPPAQADLSAAHQRTHGAGLGGAAARVGRHTARRNPARRTVRARPVDPDRRPRHQAGLGGRRIARFRIWPAASCVAAGREAPLRGASRPSSSASRSTRCRARPRKLRPPPESRQVPSRSETPTPAGAAARPNARSATAGG